MIGPQTSVIGASFEAATGIMLASVDEACKKRLVLMAARLKGSLWRFARKMNSEFAVAIGSFGRSLPAVEVVKVEPFDQVFPFSPAGCCSSLNQATT